MADEIVETGTLVGPDGKPLSQKRFKVYKSDTQTSDGERSVIAAVSTDAIDRDKEVVYPRGMDRKHYNNNPIVLWAHDYREAPIGKCLWSKVTKDGKRLITKTKFNHTPLGETIFRLYQSGDMNAFSVGFLALEYRRPNERELQERPELEDCWGVIPKSQLLEYSAVPVPANPEALCMEVSKGMSEVEAKIRQAMIDQVKTSVSACIPVDFLPGNGEIRKAVENKDAEPSEPEPLDDVELNPEPEKSVAEVKDEDEEKTEGEPEGTEDVPGEEEDCEKSGDALTVKVDLDTKSLESQAERLEKVAEKFGEFVEALAKIAESLKPVEKEKAVEKAEKPAETKAPVLPFRTREDVEKASKAKISSEGIASITKKIEADIQNRLNRAKGKA